MSIVALLMIYEVGNIGARRCFPTQLPVYLADRVFNFGQNQLSKI